MAKIIKDRSVISDPWRLLEFTAEGSAPEVPPSGDLIVPLAFWLADRDALRVRPERIGVWLKSDEDPALIAEDLPLFGVVAVAFPKVADGRGYSIGQLLRERYGYRGELRAIGDVQRDQLHFLGQCGFNAFALRPGEDPEKAMAAFGELNETYESSVERVVRLFRRHGVEWS